MKKAVLLLLLSVSAVSVAQNLALNMYADTLHHPFIYGVASGDPTTTSVQLWTYVEPSGLGQEVTWLVATDSLFTNVVASGTETAGVNYAYTVKPVATGLQPGTHYYYRFHAPGNSLSVTGRTLTAPSSPTQHIKLGVASCSSIFSGYFNGYRQMANDSSLDAIVHLGDYIYDFVDENEQVRITTPFPTSPNNLDEWRERHKYYLMDPDLRLARQMHPWIQTWDNHDFEQNGEIGTRAYFEFTPTTQPNPADSNSIYRKLSYGIADIFLLDMMNYRNLEEIAPGNNSVLGTTQRNWLKNQLVQSTARWKVVGSPKMMTQWSIAGLEQVIGASSPVLFTTSWDGFPAERDTLLSFIKNANIDNVIVISGDSHFSQSADLAPDNTAPNYIKETGEGSVAVEFMPTSISRGNFDEMGYSASLQDFIIGLIDNNNPNHIYTELISHGYGVLDIKPDSTVLQYVYCPILQLSNDTLTKQLTVMNGENHYKRYTSIPDAIGENKAANVLIYPNPATHKLWLEIPANTFTQASIYDNQGRLVNRETISGTTIYFDVEKLNAGLYVISLSAANKAPVLKRFIKVD